jgi:ATP-binding cassette subfamily C (CFTR/MRP) protein 10
MRFYDSTPRGLILNRLSSDMYTIDDSLPFILNIFLASAVGLTGIVVITTYSLPWFLIALIPIVILYYTIQNYYRWSSRELKRLTANSLSPLYQNFHDTINGLLVIRTFRHCKRYMIKNEDFLLKYIRSSYVSMAAAQWLNIRLQLLGVVMITCVSFIAVFQHVYMNTVNASKTND